LPKLRDSKAVIPAAVIDINHLGGKTALLPQLAGNAHELRVKLRQADAFVEHGHDDRHPGFGLRPGGGGRYRGRHHVVVLAMIRH